MGLSPSITLPYKRVNGRLGRIERGTRFQVNTTTKTLWAVLVLAAAAVSPALASDGGGAPAASNGCPWSQDVTLELGGHQIVVPQTVFDAKLLQTNIDGYELVPATDQLMLRIFGPRGEMWEAALTRIVGGKRCTAFYVGRPFLVASPANGFDSPAGGGSGH